ncbi:hypothetical protein [Streptomyces sp. WMMC1477]|uniref:hypothetical protein n=1 Tax=Streptomyces sp. WMMC1477 TaxID=3015155 RepID=UPI0022B72710|nr:hypothetical protein [Streptomyces sp. WMMC1477]MCZ7434628.1 hypothetical protein [Streptomyces sp. WMMC1477]
MDSRTHKQTDRRAHGSTAAAAPAPTVGESVSRPPRRRSWRRLRSAERRALRREAASTVAVLARARDFAAMRRYRSFPHRDHAGYLRSVHDLLRSLRGRGVHARVALFEPAGYRSFCAAAGLDADTSLSRARYTAEVVATGPSLSYDGEPVRELLSRLLNAAEAPGTARRPTARGRHEPTLCARADHRARSALAHLLTAAGAGEHHLVCSVTPAAPHPAPPLVAALPLRRDTAGPGDGSGETPTRLFTVVLAAGISTGSAGGVVLRTTRGGHQTVRGWRLANGWLQPLTEAEVFTAYCTDPATGEPIPPEPGVAYRPGFPLPLP